MTAATGDKFTDTFNAANPNVARVTVVRSSGATSLSCDNLAGWPTVSKVHFTTYRINTSNAVVAGTQIDWYGIVSGNTIGSLTRITGAADTGSAVGDVVEMMPTASWGHDLYSGLAVSHNKDGTMITSLPLTTPAIGSAGANFSGSSSGTTALKAAATASGTVTMPAATDTLVGKATTDTLTNKTIAGSTNSVSFNTFTNPYKFFAYHNTTQTATASTFTKLSFNTELYDTGSNFDNATNFRFTAPVAGFYQFVGGCNITVAGSTDNFSLYIYKNGTVYIELPQGSAGTPAVGLNATSPLLQLAASDYIELYVNNGTGGGKTVNGGNTPIYTYFSGMLVSIT